MGLRDDIRRIYENQGAGGLWRWAKGHGAKRWHALTKWTKDRIRHLTLHLTATQKKREIASELIHQLADEITDAQHKRHEIKKNIEEAQSSPTPNDARIEALRAKLAENNKHIESLHERLHSREVEKNKLLKHIDEVRSQRKWALKAHTIYRKKLREARKHAQQQQQPSGQPQYQSWMANGHDDYVTQGVKNFIARGVVNYGLVCTSMRRTYVPPGGSTTSYHLQSPGKAGDIAGSRMTEFQLSEYNRNHGYSGCLELFGPDNAHNLKYGNTLYLAEGTALENLHDTHVHGAF
jgi:peptidoglycan hydrolase CwlO-like protein